MPGTSGVRPDLALRDALPADAAQLAAIDQRVSPAPWSRHRYEELCGAAADSPYRLLVLAGTGNIVGFVVFSLVLDEATILNVAVDRPGQGRGNGRKLVSAALDCMERAGAGRCLLEVRRSNRPARHLYQSLGFTLDGTRKNYYRLDDGWEDALLLSRELKGLRI